MPAKPAIHTEPRGDEWVNIREGSTRALSKHNTKAEAQEAGQARAMADKVEHFIHKKDSTIGNRNSYGGDSPRRPG